MSNYARDARRMSAAHSSRYTTTDSSPSSPRTRKAMRLPRAASTEPPAGTRNSSRLSLVEYSWTADAAEAAARSKGASETIRTPAESNTDAVGVGSETPPPEHAPEKMSRTARIHGFMPGTRLERFHEGLRFRSQSFGMNVQWPSTTAVMIRSEGSGMGSVATRAV